jgi:hypothetical protein
VFDEGGGYWEIKHKIERVVHSTGCTSTVISVIAPKIN